MQSPSSQADSPQRADEPVLDDIPMDRRPKHIAIIMDGNGRWARQRDLPRIEGHMRGVDSVRRTMEACRDFGVHVLTLYCLSSENWKRPAQELEFLMALLKQYLVAERDTLVEHNLRLKVIGRRDNLPAEVRAEIQASLDACQDNTGMTLCLAIDYGARMEIVEAVRSISTRVQQGELQVSDIDEQTVSQALYTTDLPDPDLLIRTSGELRISNFLLWQISYAEIWVTETLWPEFGKSELASAIRSFAKRSRRYGGLDGTPG